MTANLNSTTAKDQAYFLHPYINLAQHAEQPSLVITRGEGIHVFDESGKRYIEGVSGLWYASLGFSERRLVEAARRQMERLPCYHAFGLKATDVSIELAEKLVRMAPVPMSKVFFANSGSEANDTAVKLVRYYNNALGRPRKKKIISRARGYHGTTVATASLTGIPRNHWDFDLPIEGILHTDCPFHYRFAEPGESEESFASRMADSLERMILAEGPDTIAAFIAEPVMGSGGIIIPPRTYFEKVQAVLKTHDVLFIVDEVISGFGRLGDMFGCETFRLKPDMIALAKALSSGYQPISALMISEPIYRAMVDESRKLGVFGHGFTYSAHPVPAAVALETLAIYEERRVVDHVRRVAPRFQAGLRRLADHPLVGDARAIGLLGGLEIVKDKASKAPFEPMYAAAPMIERKCLERGLIVRAVGDVIMAAPPLVITEGEIDDLLARLHQGLDEAEAALAESRPGKGR
ncbi:MAG: aminotransferase [Alphaproteobacteria bacterium]